VPKREKHQTNHDILADFRRESSFGADCFECNIALCREKLALTLTRSSRYFSLRNAAYTWHRSRTAQSQVR
jgi:hypothetical protein